MRKVLAVLTALLFFGGLAGAADDVTSSKNEVLAKGTSPHVRLFDTDGTGNYGVSVDHGVLQFTEEQAGGLFSAPSDAKLGIAYTPPSNVTAVASNTGGSLATGTYYIVVTAHDGGTGETFASNEVTCVITTGSVGKCVVSWTYVPPPAASYRIYVGTAAGVETHYFTGSSPYTLTSTAGTAASPPAANTAFLVYLDNLGLHFADGSSQLTAATGAWMSNGANWISAGTGKYGISTDGHAMFTPDGTLTIFGTVASPGLGTFDINDHGTMLATVVDNFQLFSNKKASADLLWDTLKPSWAVNIGDGDDKYVVYRAPATAGAPAYVAKESLDSSGNVTYPGTVTGTRVRGTSMVHQYSAVEGGPFTYGNSASCGVKGDFTQLNALTGSFSGAHHVSIRGSVNGDFIHTNTNADDIYLLVGEDNITTLRSFHMNVTMNTSGEYLPWSATVDYEFVTPPSAGSHEFEFAICSKSNGPLTTQVSSSYFSVDELP